MVASANASALVVRSTVSLTHLLQLVSVACFGHASRSISQVLALVQSCRFAAGCRMLAPLPNHSLKRTPDWMLRFSQRGRRRRLAQALGRMKNSATLEDVILWGGWTIGLPQANHTRNEDGSWSAWGEDWVVDVHIIEFSPSTLVPIDSVNRSLASGGARIAGKGWVGAMESLVESDAGKDVFRLAGTLAAPGSLMSCWVSFFRKDQHNFAQTLLQSAARSNAT